jgi:hypothetical protein
MPKSITSKKLDGLNYLVWARALKIFLHGKGRLKYLTDYPPDKGDKTYEDWMSEDSVVMGWLWHSMEPHIATTVEFSDSFKKIWDSIAESFSHQSNVCQLYGLGDHCLSTIVLSKICGINSCSIIPLLLIWGNRSDIGRNL